MKDERYLWCATDVDGYGEYNGNFGWCSSSCAAPQQNDDHISCDQCQFPFKYKGVEYNECTMEDESDLWCATKVDGNGDYNGDENFGWCKSTCTSEERTNGHLSSKTSHSNPCPSPNSYYNEFVQKCDCLPGYAMDGEDDNTCKCIEGNI